MKIAEAICAWLSYRKRMVELNLVRDTTFANQKQIAGTIKATLGELELDALRKSHVETLFIGVRLQTCRPVTVQGELNVLRQVLNWCVDEQMLDKKPRLPTVKVPNVEKPLPPDKAFVYVLKHLPPAHAAANEFMMLTGLSPHELARIQKQDFRRAVREGYGTIGIGQRDDFKVKQDSRRRWVHLNRRTAEIWMKAAAGLAATDHPFPGVYALEKAIQRLRVDAQAPPAELAQITPKTMRAWFASKMADDQPEHVLQRLLGHSPGSKVTRKHYVKSSDERLANAVQGVGA